MKSIKMMTPTALCLLILGSAASVTGCGEGTPETTSPIVSADSEEGKKALAQDEAERQLRKQKEAKASSRHKKIQLPDEG
ncbi:hypothetical protein [Paludisphaera rhizosphaerae]|uniref:hypothetical protein n=1 Tax=Paludisphaera rhizosphaerae TaxID=2711216 RepID=UPI001F108749|nr:hypothetical protein [Paludisphaera rhizosphaerae]